MHKSQMDFINTVTTNFPLKFQGTHLEIGSEDINGNLRDVFQPSEYVGVDLGPGRNVTLICRGEEIDLPSDYFDSSFSGECFEHNMNYLSTFFNMIRMTKPGGIIAFTCASRFRMEHGTTASDGGSGAPSSVAAGNEYYKNLTAKHFKPAIREELFLEYKFYRNFSEQDLYFVGIKKRSGDVISLKQEFDRMDLEISQLIKSMNKPFRVMKINAQLLKQALIRSALNNLYRNLSKGQLNTIKKVFNTGIVSK